MKSYIIKIELQDLNPLAWRRVIMPAGATYKRLYDIIQSGYPYNGYHLYEFDLPKENKIVTNNEEAYLEHQHYKKNKAMYEELLKTMPLEMMEQRQHHLKM